MAKQKTIYSCTECGGQTLKWQGQCPHCQIWNTLVETIAEKTVSRFSPVSATDKVQNLSEVEAGEETPPQNALRGQRKIYFEPGDSGDQGAWHPSQIWARDSLLAGNVITGPAALEEVSSTTILYPGDRALVLATGSVIVEVAQ